MRGLGRFSFVIFVLISVAGVLMSLSALFSPLDFVSVVKSISGADLQAVAARDPEAALGLSVFVRWVGTQVLGLDGLTLILALTAYRRGHALAFWMMWYWPVMFASHALLYRPGSPLFYVQFVNLTLTTLAQVAWWSRWKAPGAVALAPA